MIYKNGIKEYTLTTLLFGIPMGAVIGILKRNAWIGVISRALCGFLFTSLMYLFVNFQNKKYDKMHLEIAQEKQIICDGVECSICGQHSR